MHSGTIFTRQLSPHSIHILSVCRHWQDENASSLNAEKRTHSERIVSCQTGVTGGPCGECSARLEFDAEGHGPRTDVEGDSFAGGGRKLHEERVPEASRPAAMRCQPVHRKGIVRICVSRGPRDRHIIIILHFCEDCVLATGLIGRAANNLTQ